MQRTTHTTRPPQAATHTGFTLIEMLVVVSIIAIVLALSFPMIGAMRRDTSASSGVNTVAIAVAAARRYATDPSNRFARPDINLTNLDTNEPGLYSGVAAIFTPAGEIRLTKNDESARWGTGWYLERHGPDFSTLQAAGTPKRELNGFRDLGIDYILLGSDVGVAGITRNNKVSNTDPPLLIPPPFAVWFDQNGYLITTGQDTTGKDLDYQFVYYNGNYTRGYQCDVDRWYVSPYNPNAFNPNHGDFDRNNFDSAADKYVVPFERLEAVIGVFVYSQEAFENAVADGTFESWEFGVANPAAVNANNQKYWDWMKANGQMILFSRQTGMMMRNRDE